MLVVVHLFPTKCADTLGWSDLYKNAKINKIESHISLEAATKARASNTCALHVPWVQWATSQDSSDVQFCNDLALKMQEFLQYQQTIPKTLSVNQLHI